MSYEAYRYIFIISAILCGIMLVASIIVFFVLKIPKVISDLSGLTAKKAIKNIREQNERTGDKVYSGSQVNRDRGRLTDKMTPSGNIMQKTTDKFNGGMRTQKIATQNLETEVLTNETTVLSTANETTILESESAQTTVLNQETTVLQNETTILSNNSYDGSFKIEIDITYIHTNEIIGAESMA